MKEAPYNPTRARRIELLLRRIVLDLPLNRDWLDPQLEGEARVLLGLVDPKRLDRQLAVRKREKAQQKELL